MVLIANNTITVRVTKETKQKLDDIKRQMKENYYKTFQKTPKNGNYDRVIYAVISPEYNENSILIDHKKLKFIFGRRRAK